MTVGTIDGIPVVGLAGGNPAYTATAAAPENAVAKALASEAVVLLAPSMHMARFGAPIMPGTDRQAVVGLSKHRPILDFSHLPAGTPCVQLKQGVSVARPELRSFGVFCGGVAAAPYLWFDTAPAVEGPDLMPVVYDLLIIGAARRLLVGGTMMGGGREFEVHRCRFEGLKDPEGVAFEAASSDGSVVGNHMQTGRLILDHASIRSNGNKIYGYWGGPAYTYGSYARADDYVQDGAGNGVAVNGSDSHITVYTDSVGIGTAGKDAMSCAVEVNGPRNTVNGRVCMRAGRGGRWVRSPDAPNGAFGTMHWIKYGPNAHDCDVRLGTGEAAAPFVSRVLGQVPSSGSHVFPGPT